MIFFKLKEIYMMCFFTTSTAFGCSKEFVLPLEKNVKQNQLLPYVAIP